MTNTTIKLKEKALKINVENFKNNFKITEHTIYNIKEVQNVKIQNLLLNDNLFHNIEFFNEDIWLIKDKNNKDFNIELRDSLHIEVVEYELARVCENYFMDINSFEIYQILDFQYFPELEKIDI